MRTQPSSSKSTSPTLMAGRAALVVAALAIAALTGCGEGAAVEGRLQRLVADHFSGPPDILYVLETAGGDLDLDFGGADPDLETGMRLQVRGESNTGGRLRVRSLDIVELAPTVIQMRRSALVVDPAIPPVSKKLAIILLNFKNDMTQSITPDAIKARVFTDARSTKAFIKEESYGFVNLEGKNSPDGDVFGWLTIPNDNTPCSASTWSNAALAAAQDMGMGITGYDHYVFIFPRTSACTWAGLGQQPGRNTWINGTSAQVIDHELGHNFRNSHASTIVCTEAAGGRVTLSDKCISSEYGNPFDIMGRGLRHTNVINKTRAGWLSEMQTQTITVDGTYMLLPQEMPSTGIQALRTPIDKTYYYYLEYRQPFGVFDNFMAADPAVNGVIVMLAPAYTSSRNSQLLDMNPATTSFSDAPLGLGKTYDDPNGKVKITLVERTAAAAMVKFEFPGGTAMPSDGSVILITDAAPPETTDAGPRDAPVAERPADAVGTEAAARGDVARADADPEPMVMPAGANDGGAATGLGAAGGAAGSLAGSGGTGGAKAEVDAAISGGGEVKDGSGGCGCRIGAAPAAHGLVPALAVMGLLLVRRRRRTR